MNSDAIIRKEMIIGKFRSKLTYIFNGADLEDVENIINFYEQKVNQLETNRDEAIEYLRYALDEEKETPSKHNDWRLDLLEIIGRGKE